MTQTPDTCPKCNLANIYFDGTLWNCPDCFHEWTAQELEEQAQSNVVLDANGNELADGDSVTVVKDLKVKGSSSSLKVGTKVKNIKIIDGADGHNIACKIPGFGAMNLKSEFIKKN